MPLKEILEKYLSEEIKNFSPLNGGDINEVYKIKTLANAYAVKINKESDFPEMLQKESDGLKILTKAGVTTPEVIAYFTNSGYQFLILEFIQEEPVQNNFWKKFAIDLAKMHRNHNDYFGLEYDNYIGSLKQINTLKNNWSDFFIEDRMIPLMEKAYDDHLLNKSHLKQFDHFFKHIDELIPRERPSLIHGDLWSGNLMCGTGQTPVFIDPAVYYGHREIDIAMTQMFGGFNDSFIAEYNNVFPLEKDWEKRIRIHNLYPSLVHLNLFGSGYLRGIENVINRF